MQHLVTTSLKAALLASALCSGKLIAQTAPMFGADPVVNLVAAAAESGYLGVYVDGPADGGGVRLADIVEDSPAAKAGLKAGDVIVAIADRTTASEEELRSAIASLGAGNKVKITFLRDGEKRRTSARLAAAPTEEAETDEPNEIADPVEVAGAGGSHWPMIEIVETPEAAGAPPATGGGWLGVQLAGDEGGANVAAVIDGSPAAAAGLQAGDVIVRVDGAAIESVDGLVRVIGGHAAGDKVRLVLLRDGEEKKLKVTLGSKANATMNVAPSGAGIGGVVMEAPVALPPPAAQGQPRRVRIAAAPSSAAGAGGAGAHAANSEALSAELKALRRQVEDLRARCEKQQQQLDAIRAALGGGGQREPEPVPEPAAGSEPAAVAFAFAGQGGGDAFELAGPAGGARVIDLALDDHAGELHQLDGGGLLQLDLDVDTGGGADLLFVPNLVATAAADAACEAGDVQTCELEPTCEVEETCELGPMTLALKVDADGMVSAAQCSEAGGEECCPVTEGGSGEFQIVIRDEGRMAGTPVIVTERCDLEPIDAEGDDGHRYSLVVATDGTDGSAHTKRVTVHRKASIGGSAPGGGLQFKVVGAGGDGASIGAGELPAEFGKSGSGQTRRVAVKVAGDCASSCGCDCVGCEKRVAPKKAATKCKAKAKKSAPKTLRFSTGSPSTEEQLIVVTPEGGDDLWVLNQGDAASPGVWFHDPKALPGRGHGMQNLRLRRLAPLPGMRGHWSPTIRLHRLGGDAAVCPAQKSCESCGSGRVDCLGGAGDFELMTIDLGNGGQCGSCAEPCDVECEVECEGKGESGGR
jgi:membrane-associated protease RseP (regulator of RpoE activity)